MITRPLTAEERGITQPIPFGWYMLDYSADLAVGQVKPLRYFGQEIVLFRGEDGVARALDPYCRHLGAHMGHGGRVKGSNLECPFHAWQYDETGAVVEIPYARVIPPQVKRPCIKSWPVVERNRLIWAWYHPENVEPLWDVVELPEATDPNWTDYERHEWVVPVHIQDMAENGADAAHFRYIHGTASYPDMETVFDGPMMRGQVKARMDTPRGQIDGSITSTVMGPGQSWVRFEGIAETMLIAGVTPVERDLVHARFNFTLPKDGHNRAGQAVIRDIVKQFNEDFPIWQHKRFTPQPIICDGDGPIMRWRQFYSQFYVGQQAQPPMRAVS